MKKADSILASTSGFTTVELIIVITVLCILVAIIAPTYDTVHERTRFAKVKGDMDAIAQAVYTDYSNTLVWAASSTSAVPMPPSIAVGRYMNSWPDPPCEGWTYNWEDWSGYGIPAVGVTVRDVNDNIVWIYCVDTSQGGNCYTVDPINSLGPPPTEISTTKTKYVTCAE